MCTIDFICNYWFIISVIGLILGVWVGGLLVFIFLRKYINNDKEKLQKINDLSYTKNQLIKHVRELEDELELRDKRNTK